MAKTTEIDTKTHLAKKDANLNKDAFSKADTKMHLLSIMLGRCFYICQPSISVPFLKMNTNRPSS